MRYKLSLIIILFACSSPYYNTFYNAEKLFKKGELEYFKQTANRETKFKSADLTKAIDKAVSVLRNYGDSLESNAYADDAYFMIAKASYYLGDYYTASEAVHSLEKNIPNSELNDPAKVILWNSQIQLRNETAAKEILSEINEKNDALIYAESQLSLANLFRKDERLLEERNYLLKGIEITKSIEEETEELFRLQNDLLRNLFQNNYKRHDSKASLEDLTFFSLIQNKQLKHDVLDLLFELNLAKNDKGFSDFILKLKDDPDFTDDINDLNQLLLIEAFLQKDSLDFFSNFNKMRVEQGRKLPIKTQYLAAKFYDTQLTNVDSALYFYKKSSARLKNPLRKDVINRQLFLQKFQKLNEKRKKIIKTIKRLNLIPDSLSQLQKDSIKQLNQVEVKSEEEKLTNLIYDEAVFRFEAEENEASKNLFKQFISQSKDSNKLSQSYLYLASLAEEKQKLKADSIYRFVYQNFPKQRSNIDLKGKLNIHKERGENPNSESYKQIIDRSDFDELTPKKLQELISKANIDTGSFEYQKLEYLLLERKIARNEKEDSLLVKDIAVFLKRYTESPFAKELKKYDLVYREEQESLKEEKPLAKGKKFNIRDDEELLKKKLKRGKRKFLDDLEKVETKKIGKNSTDVIPLTKLKKAYTYSKKMDVDVKLSISIKGHVTKVQILSKLDKLDEDHVKRICRKWKFNTGSKPFRYFFYTLHFTNVDRL